ncbi:hypothetical protein [Mesorhizobium sp. WSM4904]|uniref:hypothetical protein n=1 Tax=Mesorhizobium sp. WSM4904 TaxID=3038545 RepID=UPI00241826B4|nr:hypothetical protein [Mesorhizobium sp. WSM4904]WFP63589.1 hypothetical protein QAZ47_03110 [Mesorhizobium sp. WSM4904]
MVQLEEIAPWIQEERASALDRAEVHRASDDVDSAAPQFSDRIVDAVNVEAQMVPAMEAEGRVQVLRSRSVDSAEASDDLYLETVVVRRCDEGEGESHRLDAARVPEIEDVLVPSQCGVEVSDAEAGVVAAHRFER